MPEETTGVKQAVAEAPPAPEAEFSADDTAAGATDQPDVEKELPPVPYTRFREINERNRTLEQQVGQLQQGLSALLQQRQQPAALATAPQPAAAAAGRPATLEPFLRGAETEQDAEYAHRAVSDVSRSVAEELDKKTSEQLRQEMRQLFTEGLGGYAAIQQVDRNFQNYKAQGLIDDDNERAIRADMQRIIQQDERWGRGNNPIALMDSLYMNRVKAGDLKPGSYKPRHTPGASPLQPGQQRTRAKTEQQRQAEWDDKLRQMQKDFPNRLGRLSIERMREIAPPDMRPDPPPEMTPGGTEIPARVRHDRYVHHRPEPR